MPQPTDSDIAQQLAEIRRELRFMRVLLSLLCLGSLVFICAPSYVTRFGEWVFEIVGYANPTLGLLVSFGIVLVVAASLVSRFSPSRPEPPKVKSHDPQAY